MIKKSFKIIFVAVMVFCLVLNLPARSASAASAAVAAGAVKVAVVVAAALVAMGIVNNSGSADEFNDLVGTVSDDDSLSPYIANGKVQISLLDNKAYIDPSLATAIMRAAYEQGAFTVEQTVAEVDNTNTNSIVCTPSDFFTDYTISDFLVDHGLDQGNDKLLAGATATTGSSMANIYDAWFNHGARPFRVSWEVLSTSTHYIFSYKHDFTTITYTFSPTSGAYTTGHSSTTTSGCYTLTDYHDPALNDYWSFSSTPPSWNYTPGGNNFINCNKFYNVVGVDHDYGLTQSLPTLPDDDIGANFPDWHDTVGGSVVIPLSIPVSANGSSQDVYTQSVSGGYDQTAAQSGDISSGVISTANPGITGIWSLLDEFFSSFFARLADTLTNLFTLDPALALEIKETFDLKFGFLFDFGDYISDLIDDLGATTPPVVYLDLGDKSSGYSYGSRSIAILDLSWFAPYRAQAVSIMSAFVYLLFFWRIYKKLPGWIGAAK